MKNEKSNKNFSKFYFFVMVFMVLSFSLYLFYKYNSLLKYNEKIAELNTSIEVAKKESRELNKQKEYKKSDEYIERIARDKLGMVKKNEIIFYNK